ncbi:hypothetical protein SAMN05444673_3185 [Bacillus sp. OV166]|nr:hypothetical protein SAMN05444673_3185 [Bacillus sp. OV166]
MYLNYRVHYFNNGVMPFSYSSNVSSLLEEKNDSFMSHLTHIA